MRTLRSCVAIGISYVVPTLNEESYLESTLDSICSQPGDKEIIISDGGSVDRTLNIARSRRCAIIECPKGRGRQLNVGAQAARHTVLMFLHADTLLPPYAAIEIESILSMPKVVAGSFRLRFEPSNAALRFYASCSKFNHPIFTYGDQGLFIRRPAFDIAGKFAEYPILEDIEFQRRIRNLGRFRKSRLSVTTSSRRFARRGPIRQQLVNSFIIAAYYGGANPHLLSRFYSDFRQALRD